jgi:hypothetical protein
MDQLTPARRFIFSLIYSGHRTRCAKRMASLCAAAPILWGSLALAQDDFWINPAGGSWTTAANWSAGVPNGGDVIFNLGSTAAYAVTVPSGQFADELDVDTDNAILSVTGSFLQVAGPFGGGGPVQIGQPRVRMVP